MTTAYAPAAVTLVFSPTMGARPEEARSPGLAVALDPGVTAEVAPAAVRETTMNGAALRIAAVDGVLDRLGVAGARVALRTEFPLGCGFGISAASALSTALAANGAFGLGLTPEACALAAHLADVAAGTGIGGVASQFVGGVVLRRAESGPFDVERLDAAPTPLSFLAFDPLSTEAMLRDAARLTAIRAAAAAPLAAYLARRGPVDLAALFDDALGFARAGGFLTDPRVAAAVDAVRAAGGRATMCMVGASVLATRAPADGRPWRPCAVAARGAR
jgi:pantoate kinase